MGDASQVRRFAWLRHAAGSPASRAAGARPFGLASGDPVAWRHASLPSVALTFALVIVSATACDESPTSPSELIGQTWRLLSIDRSGLPSIPAPSDRRFTIEFQDGGRLAVRADCNSCSGTCDLSRSQFNIRPLACTRAFCGNDSLDTPFLQALSEARSARIDGSELTIRADSVTLRFTRE